MPPRFLMVGRICSCRAPVLANKRPARSLSPRLAAVQAITAVLRKGRNLPDALEGVLGQVSDERDRALTQALAYGVVRWYWRLNWLLSELLNTPLKQRDADIQVSLMLGLYQLMEMRVPDHAAVGETVKLASQLKKPWAKSLLNGVLRNFQRSSEDLWPRVPTQPGY